MLDRVIREVFEGSDNLEIQDKCDQFLATARRLHGIDDMAYLGVHRAGSEA
jgi:hypothetical protein